MFSKQPGFLRLPVSQTTSFHEAGSFEKSLVKTPMFSDLGDHCEILSVSVWHSVNCFDKEIDNMTTNDFCKTA